jgi:hypothetical protein
LFSLVVEATISLLEISLKRVAEIRNLVATRNPGSELDAAVKESFRRFVADIQQLRQKIAEILSFEDNSAVVSAKHFANDSYEYLYRSYVDYRYPAPPPKAPADDENEAQNVATDEKAAERFATALATVNALIKDLRARLLVMSPEKIAGDVKIENKSAVVSVQEKV